MKGKWCIAVCILLTCLLNLCIAPAEAQVSYSLGKKIEDFEFSTYDGKRFKLSEVLKDKDAVLINIWATWCGPCKYEFPYLQEAYDKYQDQVEVIALSCEETDTPDTLKAFAQQYGLTFKVGRDSFGFLRALGTGSIPTSLLIDRFGTICFIESGMQTSAASFERLFEVFVGDDYTESILLDGIPAMKPAVKPCAEQEIARALGATAFNPSNAYVWPMTVTEKEGRQVVVSTNGGYASTRAEVSAVVSAKAGNAISITFKTSTESICDLMRISVNGQHIKSFGGNHDWTSYAIPVEADGEYTLKISYQKNASVNEGEDCIWIDSIAVIENADEAIISNPTAPISERLAVSVADASAREIVIEDPYGLLAANFGEARYYIAGGDETPLVIGLTEVDDPEEIFLALSYDGSQTPVTQLLKDGEYRAKTKVDSMDETGYMCSYAAVCSADGSKVRYALLFKDENNLSAFVKRNGLGEWRYVDQEPSDDTQKATDSATYILRCMDQNGRPVQGVMLQVCDETTCQVLVSDADGICRFTGIPYAWEIHVLKVPAGYTAEAPKMVVAPVEGGEIIFRFTAN